jgi:hypothetical protein
MRMSRKYHLAFATAAVGVVCMSIPAAWADDPQATKVQTKKGARLLAFPKAIAGFCVGALVGTPICFVRKFPSEVTEGAHGFVGSIGSNDSKKLLFVPACVAWMPVAGVVSALEAPGFALKDAYTAEKPFSKEQFSLGELP